MIVLPYVTPRTMQKLDRRAQERYGISSLILMENAGRSAAEAVARLIRGGKKRRVVCICGRGNNGGDGFVACRHLRNKGIRVEAFMMAGSRALTDGARLNRDILERSRCPVRRIATAADIRLLRRSLKGCACIVDAIFGIGFSGAPRPPYDEVIAAVNASGRPVVSLDVPSGLDALTGRAQGACIRARTTITFGYPKTGLAKNDGPFYAGRILVADISLPR
jgi:NAD(P)H-hydrate epimerase